MRVLLLMPHKTEYVFRVGHSPSLSLLCVAAALRQAGHEPLLLDLDVLDPMGSSDRDQFCIQYTLNRIEDFHPGLVGMTCFTAARLPFLNRLADMIKERHEHLPVIMGGMHPTLFFREILEHYRSIDAIVLGEGETQAVALAHAYSLAPKKAIRELHTIEALAFRDNDGQVCWNPRKGYIDNLDSLPMPAWDLLHFEDYYADHSSWHNPRSLEINMSVPVYTSRSCPFDCIFCSSHNLMGRGLRLRSPSRVVDEMELLYDTYGQNYFGFVDDNLTLNRKHIMALCNEIIRRGMVIQFESSVGYNLNSLDEEVVAAMVQAGCTYIMMPIEHGNDYIRNEVIGKRLSRDKIFEVAAACKKHDILTSATCIMGFPEDTKDTVAETLALLNELQLDINNVLNLIPFPGTKVFDRAVRENLFLNPIDLDSLWTGNWIMDPKERQFYIKPYNMTLEEMFEFRDKFDAIRLNSDRVKRLQGNNPAIRS